MMAAVTVALPFTPRAAPLGLVPLASSVLTAPAGPTAVYVIANEVATRVFPPDRS
jgi:P-type Mg2+ transporter